MNLRTRLQRLTAAAPPSDPPPRSIEQDAPGAPIRFSLGGVAVEMGPSDFHARWPGLRFIRWGDQPWAAAGGTEDGEGPHVPVNYPTKGQPRPGDRHEHHP